jgi:3-hydroxyacyl-[acyl-carrier-protein] dehydratase
MPTIDINEIKNLLPHRYPFLLLDKVIDYEAGLSLQAIKNVTVNEPFFQGHFPVKPIMPGVLIVEALAQASAILGFVSIEEKPEKEELYFLVGVDKARFRKPVEPGDQLILETKHLSVRRNIWKFDTVAYVNDKKVASAEILTTVVDP